MHGPMNVKSLNNISKWQMGFNSAFKGLKFNSCFLLNKHHVLKTYGGAEVYLEVLLTLTPRGDEWSALRPWYCGMSSLVINLLQHIQTTSHTRVIYSTHYIPQINVHRNSRRKIWGF
jgi:hypothetical protein